jgi:hypothetical protein
MKSQVMFQPHCWTELYLKVRPGESFREDVNRKAAQFLRVNVIKDPHEQLKLLPLDDASGTPTKQKIKRGKRGTVWLV